MKRDKIKSSKGKKKGSPGEDPTDLLNRNLRRMFNCVGSEGNNTSTEARVPPPQRVIVPLESPDGYRPMIMAAPAEF